MQGCALRFISLKSLLLLSTDFLGLLHSECDSAGGSSSCHIIQFLILKGQNLEGFQSVSECMHVFVGW